jgi:hypothetical protein
MPTKYPEHEKLEKIKDFSQSCGEFLDWLQNEKEVFLSVYFESGWQRDEGFLYRSGSTVQDLLAEFFNIDREKLEDEKMAMLEELRSRRFTPQIPEIKEIL